MNQELVETVARELHETDWTVADWDHSPLGIRNSSRLRAKLVVKAVGEHLLMELAGFDNACEMRTKIAKECGL